MQKIGLVLGSGGAKGIAHIAFLKVLDELNIKPSIISGSSIGSFIGALYASGLSAEKMQEVILDMNLKKLTKLLDPNWKKKTGLIKGTKIMDFFKQHAKTDSFSRLKIPTKIVATDLWKQKSVVFEKGKLSDAVRASISIPGIFKPAELNGKILIDGGITNPLPCNIVKKHCDYLIAIDVVSGYLPKRPLQRQTNLFSNLMATFDIMQAQLIGQQLKETEPDMYLCPKMQKVGLLEFYKGRKILEKVEKDAKNFKKHLKKELNL